MATHSAPAGVPSDSSFERQQNRVRRIAWWMIAPLLAASPLGVCGDGGVTRSTETRADLAVEFFRITRTRMPTVWHIVVRGTGDSARLLTISGDAVHVVDAGQTVGGTLRSRGEQLLTVAVPPSSITPRVVTLVVRPTSPGWMRSAVSLSGERAVQVSQMILP